MPLLNDSELPPAPLPSVQDIAELEAPQVFYIPFTAEIFANYEDYFKRIMLYRSKLWTCSETKKQGLTYKEALESEKKALKKADILYPNVWVKPTLEMIHYSRYPLNELVDHIYDYFRGTRFVNEYVYVDVPTNGTDRAVERAMITEKLPNTTPATLERRVGDKRQIQRDLREAREDNSRVPEDHHHYRIQLVNNPTREFIVAPNQMRRGRQTLSKQTFKKYVKEVAKKEKWIGSPWIVKPNLVARYGLSNSVPTHIEDIYKNNGGDAAAKKRRRALDCNHDLIPVNENPIEDTELFSAEFQLKHDPENPIPPRPKLSFEYGKVSKRYGLDLVQIYTLVHAYGTPLNLHPFYFYDFIEVLGYDGNQGECELLPEIFGALLKFACIEYQSKFEPATASNAYYHPLPIKSEEGIWNEPAETVLILEQLDKEYEKFNLHEKVAVDQWYKWRPGQWYASKKKKTKTVDCNERLKAWPVALFGFIKDWFHSENDSNELKLNLLGKLLLSTPASKEDEMDIDHIDDVEASIHSSHQSSSNVVSDDEVDHSKRKTRPRTSNKEVSSLKERKKSMTPAKTACQFEDLCKRMELAFWTFTADERVILLSFLVSNCVLDSDVLRTFRDDSLERTTELKKEQREIARRRKILAVSIADLEKAVAGDHVSPAELNQVEIKSENVSEASDNDMDSELYHNNLFRRPVRKSRRSISRRDDIQKFEQNVDLSKLSAEQMTKRQELQKLELEDKTLNRRENVLDFEIRASQAISKFKPFGRDRYCNKFWWFDGGLASVSIDAITKINDLPDQIDPFIPQEFATGCLFVEQVCDPDEPLPDALFDACSEVRQGIIDGEWGYYSEPEQITQLLKWMDVRGIRESTLQHNLEYFSEFIIDGMQRRKKLLQGEIIAREYARINNGFTEDGNLYKEPFLEYKNHWGI